MSVRPLFAWYDLWVGFCWDQKSRKLYILPVPTVGVVIEFGPKKEKPPERREYADADVHIW